MFEHWFRYGDTEVANSQRATTYVKNGLTPVGAVIGDCADCEDLAEVNGDGEYRTPVLDNAPWYTPEDPDSGDFAGIIPVSVTGLAGSTIQAEVLERLGDGGLVGARRAASRPISVTADLVGATPEATAVGLEWLTAALHPPCADSVGCQGDTLHLYSTCPAACEGMTDPDAALVPFTYHEPASFSTSGRLSTVEDSLTNYATNPSAEYSTITGWESNTVFGAYVSGTVTKQTSPSVIQRPNAARIATPAMSAGQKTLLNNAIPISVTGWYLYSLWVYVPSATVTRVRARDAFGGWGPWVATKDQWVCMTVPTNLTSGGTAYMGIETDPDQVPATGSFIYADGAMLRLGGGFAAASTSAQGALSTDVEGWYGEGAFGSLTTPLAITKESFAGPDGVPGTIKVAWKDALTGGTFHHAVYNPLIHLVQGKVYTIECDIYVPTGHPDVFSDMLYNGFGDTYSTKNAWVHVRHTFIAKGPNNWFGFRVQNIDVVGEGDPGEEYGEGEYGDGEYGGGGEPGSVPDTAGKFMYIDNWRVMPGFSAPEIYFDGETTDSVVGNLAAGISAISNGTVTVTPGVVHANEIWTRVTAGADGHGVRVLIPLASLANGREYIASWLVHNQSGAPVDLQIDWADEGSTIYTIQPSETRRIFTRARRSVYDATFRFTDLGLLETGTAILFRDVTVTAVAPHSYAWTGTADQSTSVSTPLGDDFIFLPDAGDSTIQGPVFPGICDDVWIEWIVSSPTGVDVGVIPKVTNPGGVVTQEGDMQIVGSTPIAVRMLLEGSPEFPDDWRPTLTSERVAFQMTNDPQITIHSLTVTHRPILTLEECVAPYRRTFRNVVTIDGPRVIEKLTMGDTTEGSTVTRVEWTWVATDPNLWHQTIPLITGQEHNATVDPDYKAPGIQLSGHSLTTYDPTVCTRPTASMLTCADNTSCVTLVAPPVAPTIADPCVMNFAGASIRRRYFEIPADISPQALGILSWKFVNDASPKLGIRVRIFEDTDPAFVGPATECSWIEEFTIEYLAPNQTLFIDGPGNDVYVQCGVDVYGDPIYASSLRNVRGNYGGPFRNSLIGCGHAYLIVIDQPTTYTATSGSHYISGEAQGVFEWSVDLTRRA